MAVQYVSVFLDWKYPNKNLYSLMFWCCSFLAYRISHVAPLSSALCSFSSSFLAKSYDFPAISCHIVQGEC